MSGRLTINTGEGWSRGLTNLASALAGNPGDEARVMALGANAGYHNARAAEVTTRMQGALALSGSFRRGAAPGELYAGAALAGPDFLQNMPTTALGFAAAQPGATPDSLANFQIGARVPFQQTAPGFREGEAGALQRAIVATGPGYAQVARQQGQWADTPTLVADPNAPGGFRTVRQADVVSGGYTLPPSQNQAQGVATQRALAGDTGNGVLAALAPSAVAQGQAAAAATAAAPVMVWREGRLNTIPRGQMQPGDVEVRNNDAPLDMVPIAALAGQQPDPAAVSLATQLAQAGRTARQPQPDRVNMQEAGRVREALAAEMRNAFGAEPTPELLSALLVEATGRMQGGRDAASAIVGVVQDFRSRNPDPSISGRWNPFATNRVEMPAGGALAGQAPAPAAGGQAAPAGQGGQSQAAPPGMRLVGRTPDGRPVYQGADGRNYVQ